MAILDRRNIYARIAVYSKRGPKLQLKAENVECSTCTFGKSANHSGLLPMYSPRLKQQRAQEGLSIDVSQPGLDVDQQTEDVRERLLRQHGELELVDWKPIKSVSPDAFEGDVDIHVKWFTAERNDEDFRLPCTRYPCATQPPALPHQE